MWIILILIIIALIFYLYQYHELHSLIFTSYTVYHADIQTPLRACVIADVHGYEPETGYASVYARLREYHPDMILIPGDLITSRDRTTIEHALILMKELVQIAPCYLSLGNHELKLLDRSSAGKELMQHLEQLGVCVLDDSRMMVTVKGQTISIAGYSAERRYYSRFSSDQITYEEFCRSMPEADPEHFQILLAHTPAGEAVYRKWGADLICCGHYHGGVVLVGQIGLITPQLQFASTRCHGCYEADGSYMVVSGGLGVHSIPLRIFNKPEIVLLDIRGKSQN